MSLPQPGQPAPDFTLPSDTGEPVTLSAQRGHKVVLFFYPKADTPGCTKEACGFRDEFTTFEKHGVVVLGLSPDTVKDEAKFKQKYSLPYPLLADAEHAIAEAYGVWGQKKFLGREYLGVLRTTFIIDEAGTIARVFENVRPVGHSAEILAALAA
jgi:peroxiredoxin Q/BCP